MAMIPEDRFYRVGFGAAFFAGIIAAIRHALVNYAYPVYVLYFKKRQARYNMARGRLRRLNYGYNRGRKSNICSWRRPGYRRYGARRYYCFY